MERIFATASLVGVVSFIVWAGTGYPEPFRVANFSAGPGAMPWEGVSRTVLVLRLKICVFFFNFPCVFGFEISVHSLL